MQVLQRESSDANSLRHGSPQSSKTADNILNHQQGLRHRPQRQPVRLVLADLQDPAALLLDLRKAVRHDRRPAERTTLRLILRPLRASHRRERIALRALLAGSAFDVILVDLNMPGLSGHELIGSLASEFPTTPIIVLSMINDGPVVTQAMKAGAKGYVTKGSPADILIMAIRKVPAGERFLDPGVVNALLFDVIAPRHKHAEDLLSERELEILKLISTGLHLSEIAEKLYLSPKTVSTHKANLMHKLRIDNNADLIRYAEQEHLKPGGR